MGTKTQQEDKTAQMAEAQKVAGAGSAKPQQPETASQSVQEATSVECSAPSVNETNDHQVDMKETAPATRADGIDIDQASSPAELHDVKVKKSRWKACGPVTRPMALARKLQGINTVVPDVKRKVKQKVKQKSNTSWPESKRGYTMLHSIAGMKWKRRDEYGVLQPGHSLSNIAMHQLMTDFRAAYAKGYDHHNFTNALAQLFTRASHHVNAVGKLSAHQFFSKVLAEIPWTSAAQDDAVLPAVALEFVSKAIQARIQATVGGPEKGSTTTLLEGTTQTAEMIEVMREKILGLCKATNSASRAFVASVDTFLLEIHEHSLTLNDPLILELFTTPVSIRRNTKYPAPVVKRLNLALG